MKSNTATTEILADESSKIVDLEKNINENELT